MPLFSRSWLAIDPQAVCPQGFANERMSRQECSERREDAATVGGCRGAVRLRAMTTDQPPGRMNRVFPFDHHLWRLMAVSDGHICPVTRETLGKSRNLRGRGSQQRPIRNGNAMASNDWHLRTRLPSPCLGEGQGVRVCLRRFPVPPSLPSPSSWTDPYRAGPVRFSWSRARFSEACLVSIRCCRLGTEGKIVPERSSDQSRPKRSGPRPMRPFSICDIDAIVAGFGVVGQRTDTVMTQRRSLGCAAVGTFADEP